MAGIATEAVNVCTLGRDFAPDGIRAITKSNPAGMVELVGIMTRVTVDRRTGGHVVASGANRISIMPGQNIAHRGGVTKDTGCIRRQRAAVM